MTNDDVVRLTAAGFSEDLVVTRIGTSEQQRFDLSADGLVALKQAGVGERVIAVMLGGPDPGASAPNAPAPAAAPPVPGTAAQPFAVAAVPPPSVTSTGEEAGIYLLDGSDRIMLEPTVFSGGKTGGILAYSFTMGIKKAKWKAVVRSPRAVQRLGQRPEFLFIFERQSSGLSHAAAMLGASSPNEFVLAQMQVTDHERELVVGEMGIAGASTGTRSQDTVQMTIARLSPGVYKVAPRDALTRGEYCFFYAGGMSTFQSSGQGKLFDFGVD